MRYIICPACQAQHPLGTPSCSFCGQPLGQGPAQPQQPSQPAQQPLQQPVPPQPAPPVQPQPVPPPHQGSPEPPTTPLDEAPDYDEPRSNPLKTILIALAVVLLLGGGGAGYYFYDKHQKEVARLKSLADVKENEVERTAADTAVAEPVVAAPTPSAAPAQAAPAPQSTAGPQGNWPQTSQRRLQESELYGMSSSELRLMRNEIYARHGYIFASDDLRNHFSRLPWYTPRSKNVTLTKIEEYNVNLIKAFE